MQPYNWDTNAPYLSAEQLVALKNVLIVAPHQDDESLGCGGTISLLKRSGVPVHVVFVSDGSMSHPNSVKYPAVKLVALREAEATAALSILGVSSSDITFLRLLDSSIPRTGSADFDAAVTMMSDLIDRVKPQTIFVPWRRDPHTDHRATWQITDAALKRVDGSVKRLEYFIWLWERASAEDLPRAGEMKFVKVDISNTLLIKRQAIQAHLSQTTSLIDDDANGFTLSATVLAHFDKRMEIFLEAL